MIESDVLEKLEFTKILHFAANYCQTENGKLLILSSYPLTDLTAIKKEGELVTQAKEILIKNEFPPIEYLPVLDEVISKTKIEGSFLDSKRILEILKLSVISRNLFQYLKNNSEDAPQLFALTQNLFIDKVFEHHIKNVINENGEVKENASRKLAEIRSEIRKKNDELIKSVNRLIKSYNEQDFIREDYLTLRDGRIVVPVKAEHKRHVKGFIHSESSTGQTVYIEPEETLDLNNDIVSLSFAEKREIERILKELTKKIGSTASELSLTLRTISYIDSIFARAKYSIEIIGSFPELDSGRGLELNEARHPILLKKYGKTNTVPLKVKLKANKIILITGPNAGGKTVVLKTIGLLSLMVQSGFHIPAGPDSNFPVYHNLLLDIGDQQSIEDDLSTFSSHLLNIKNILEKSDKESLVLLDEVGTGTDPTEGSALASAVLFQLKDKGTTVFATTHHGELKLIANDIDGFENAAMEFDHINLKPTYTFKQGIPGSSYAFEIAHRIGFEEGFINLAKQNLDSGKHKIEKFLIDIEAKSNLLESKLKSMEIENSRLQGLSNLYKQNIEKLDREKKDILKMAKADADNYLKNINKKFEQVIKDLKESNANKETIRSSQKIIKELKDENKNLFSEEVDLLNENYDFAVGDYASIKNTNTIGEIIELSPNKKNAVLKTGTIKMKVNLDALIPAKQIKEKENLDHRTNYSIESPQIRIDIRGEKPEEAEFEIVKFIDNAYISNLNRVEILHGKGTGALKKTVKDILKNHDKVKNYYFAPIEFGGEGVTVAELK